VKMWSGRFRQPLDPHFEEWQRSFPFDQKLLRYELAASRAHAQALKAAGIITSAEFGLIAAALGEIGKTSEQQAGYFNDPEAEDVHHFVEKKLVALVGETGKKLNSGRSRNEQIATDLRLYVRAAIDELRSELAEVCGAFTDRAEQAGSAAMPAYTHLQPAEPVLVTHSNCRALVPYSARCKTDEAIQRAAAKGGVVGVTMVRAFVRSTGTTTIEDVLDHIDHVVKLVGVEHVGVGSDVDLDGRELGSARTSDLDGMQYTQKIYDLTEGLVRRKYRRQDIELILGGNFQRALSAIWTA